ncbi:MAG: hypothetical protein CM15mP74_14870 [Halieaceae bacterium]|nr:MAG: hypothetical protein CM15mP74_14870 [Halieaceae bacterium]
MLVLHEGRKAGPALSINEAVQLINVEGGVFWISGMRDFARGHITDALHIPAASLADRYAELEKFRDKPIVVVCKMGQSPACYKTLRARVSIGRKTVRRHDGGMPKNCQW